MFSHEDKSIFQPMIKILVFIEITIIEFYKYIIKYWQKNQWEKIDHNFLDMLEKTLNSDKKKVIINIFKLFCWINQYMYDIICDIW